MEAGSPGRKHRQEGLGAKTRPHKEIKRGTWRLKPWVQIPLQTSSLPTTLPASSPLGLHPTAPSTPCCPDNNGCWRRDIHKYPLVINSNSSIYRSVIYLIYLFLLNGEKVQIIWGGGVLLQFNTALKCKLANKPVVVFLLPTTLHLPRT